MHELKKFYIGCLTTIALVVALGAYAVPTHLVPLLSGKFGAEHWSIALATALSSRLAIVIVLGVSEWLVRTKAWKWLHPELDYSGIWKAVTTYTNVRIGNVRALPLPAEHQVLIEQDCFSIRIRPTGGSKFVNWESTAANLIDKDHFVYAYKVQYRNLDDFPSEASGYEEMKAVSRNKRDRPIVLEGTFAHCAAGQTPVLSGTAKFNRS